MPPCGGLLLSFKWLSARPSVHTGLMGEASILMGKLCVPLFCGNICIIYQANVPTFSFCHFLRRNGDLQDKGSWVADTPSSFFISALRCTNSDLWLCKVCEGCLDFNFITGCDECYTALSLWSNCCMLENAPVFYLLCLMLFITECLDFCIYLPHHFHWNCSVKFLFSFFPVL